MARLVRVGDIAQELGVSTARLRHLADIGVIPSERSPGGHRVFDPGSVRSALARLGAEQVVAPRWQRPDDVEDLVLDGVQETWSGGTSSPARCRTGWHRRPA